MTTDNAPAIHRSRRAPRWAAWFALLVGLFVLSTIILFLVDGGRRVGPPPSDRVILHLVAEGAMAATLAVGGLQVLTHRPGGRTICLTGLGMLLYSLINTSGFYVQRQEWGMVALSIALGLGAMASVVMLWRSAKHLRAQGPS